MPKNHLADANDYFVDATAETIRRDIGRLELSLTHARHLLDVLECAGEEDLTPLIRIVHDTLDALTGAMIPERDMASASIPSIHISIANAEMADRVARCLGIIQSTRRRG